MKNKKNKKSKFEKFMAIFIGIIVFGLFTAGYAMTLYDSVIAPIFVDESNTVIDSNKNGIKVSPSNTAETQIPPTDTKKTKMETLPANIEEVDGEGPSISIGSINAEHKNDPDYVTYNIDIPYAYYTKEVDGKEVKIPIPNMTGGTISLPKPTPVPGGAGLEKADTKSKSGKSSGGGGGGGGGSKSSGEE